jgi:hypothetical protein
LKSLFQFLLLEKILKNIPQHSIEKSADPGGKHQTEDIEYYKIPYGRIISAVFFADHKEKTKQCVYKNQIFNHVFYVFD